jgi:uncharacterized protein (TIGR00251 family)
VNRILTARLDGVSVVVKVKAGSKTQRLQLMPEWLAVHVHAPAVDGKANKAVYTMVGDHFHCKVTILRGELNANKVLLLQGLRIDAAEQALLLLQTDRIPDARDGLTRIERIVLYELHRAQEDFPGRRVPSVTLYGRICEYDGINISAKEFEALLARLARG